MTFLGGDTGVQEFTFSHCFGSTSKGVSWQLALCFHAVADLGPRVIHQRVGAAILPSPYWPHGLTQAPRAAGQLGCFHFSLGLGPENSSQQIRTPCLGGPGPSADRIFGLFPSPKWRSCAPL